MLEFNDDVKTTSFLVMQNFHVIIPAAGAGNRMAAVMPKQYLPLCGKPMIAHSLQTFLSSPRIASVHIALSKEDDFWAEFDFTENQRLYAHHTGGNTRAETVLNTMLAMHQQVGDNDWILVHDAARPGLTLDLLDQLLDQLFDDEVGGLLALPLADTLKQSNAAQRVQQTIPREALWQAQTPQMFRYGLLKKALENFTDSPTDEAQAVEALGLQPKLVVGSLMNMKITYPQDIVLMEALMQRNV